MAIVEGWTDEPRRVLLVEKHTRRAVYLKAALWDYFHIVGVCCTGREAFDRLLLLRRDSQARGVPWVDIVIVGALAGDWSPEHLLNQVAITWPVLRRVFYTGEPIGAALLADAVLHHTSLPGDILKVVARVSP